jgi:hypothetical protein
VNLISIILVGLIILFTFRSVTLPILLVLVIEASIWINMASPYFMDEALSFMGYMIVSAIQLGATIDYAILLTNRYMHNRETMGKKESAIAALSDSGWSLSHRFDTFHCRYGGMDHVLHQGCFGAGAAYRQGSCPKRHNGLDPPAAAFDPVRQGCSENNPQA